MKRNPRTAVQLSLLLATILAGTLVSGLSLSQTDTYPMKPVRLIVPFPPGGSTDLNARLLSPKLSEVLGQQVVVDNRSGASGIIGTELVARSAPDGYTLMMTSLTFVTSPALYSRVPYDPVSDFAPISLTSTLPSAVAVHPSVPRSLRARAARAHQSAPGSAQLRGLGHRFQLAHHR